MIRLFIHRPAMTVMFVLIFVVLGLVSSQNMVIERTPKLDFPIVTVKTVYDGASPEEIETQIIKKVEDAVAEISEIKKIISYAYENYGLVMLEFDIKADVNIKSIEVKDKVEPIINDLPKDAEKPEIAKFDPLIHPIIDLILESGTVDDRTLFEYADKKLKDEITVIEGVASVDVFGGKERQINVDLDPILMKEKFISIGQVIDTLKNKNVNIPGGTIDKASSRSAVRLLGEFRTVKDIETMPLVSSEGEAFKLMDIATVQDGHKKVETYTRFNGKNAVGLSIKKLSDGDAVKISRNIRNKLGSLRENLPPEMTLQVAFDSTVFIVRDTKHTIVNILFGIILTIFILLLFLGDVRVTIVAAVVIPTSLISALAPMDFSHFSINVMTLLAIATSLGTLIANALVVIESVDLHLSYGKDPREAALDGTREAGVAVFAAAGTNLVVFTPIAFMGGIVGKFMQQFGLTVVYATIFSLLASFTLTPMLCGLLLRPHRESRNGKNKLMYIITHFPNRMIAWMTKEYRYVFDYTFRHPVLTVIFSLLILYATKYPLAYIGNEFFTPSDQDKIAVQIEMPQGTLLEKTSEVAKEVETFISAYPEIKNYLSYIGTDGAETARITINLVPAKERQKSDLDLINELIPKAATIPDADISFGRGDAGPEESDVSVNIIGEDFDKMIEISNAMKDVMLQSGYFRSVDSSYKVPKEEIRFSPNDAQMIRYGVRNQQVGDAIRSAVRGNDQNTFKEKGEEYDIHIQYNEEYTKSLEDMGAVTVMTRDGLLPVDQLGELNRALGYPSLRRRDKERVIQLAGYLSKGAAGNVMQALDAKFKPLFTEPGYRYVWVGNAEYQEETGRELGRAFILAVILTYMLLVAVMNSFSYPFVIVSSIATSFTGVFLLLFFLGFSINIGSMMAMVMLVGLVVNNAILMLDYALKKLEEGKDVKEALWLGASVKFRAIFMTSLAIVFGALPQVFDIFIIKASMGGVIIGGMLASIVFTFLLVPILFSFVYRLKHFISERLTKLIRAS
jgi:HAE1 family hydrophobic/amphiphilic exporter-1